MRGTGGESWRERRHLAVTERERKRVKAPRAASRERNSSRNDEAAECTASSFRLLEIFARQRGSFYVEYLYYDIEIILSKATIK